ARVWPTESVNGAPVAGFRYTSSQRFGVPVAKMERRVVTMIGSSIRERYHAANSALAPLCSPLRDGRSALRIHPIELPRIEAVRDRSPERHKSAGHDPKVEPMPMTAATGPGGGRGRGPAEHDRERQASDCDGHGGGPSIV